MKKNILLSLVTVVALLINGCTTEEENTTEIVAITPTDGEAIVSRTTAISIEFSETMDVSSCESRFGLFMGNLESIPTNMTGRMDGDYSWNDDHTIMTFHGDSSLMDSAMYSICLQEGMQSHSAMGDGMMMSGMNGHGMEVTSGIISKFTTENSSLARILTISPANGSADIDLTTEIQIEFDSPMDIESCESRFGLHEGELMEMPMMGMMSGLAGGFHWNVDSTMMIFQPDSMLIDSTMYTICLMEGMQTADHNGNMMTSGMSDFGDLVDTGIFIKFLTK